jgi:Family of unknown function (DUF6527)
MNANKILQFENSIVILESLASQATILSQDQTQMPDGQGTVASRFNDAVLKFGPAVIDMLLPLLDPSANNGAAAGSPENSGSVSLDTVTIAGIADPGAAGSKTAICIPKADYNELKQPGDFFFSPNKDHIVIFIPGEGIVGLTIHTADKPQLDPKVTSWLWDGDADHPTLSPSIFISPPSGWHGWLTKGFLSNVSPSGPPAASTNAPGGSVAPASPGKIIDQVQPEPHKPAKFWMAGMTRD